MRVLAIETSCDETGVAILEGEKTPAGFAFQTLGSSLLSQAPLHEAYGGVYPNLAKREHEKNLPVILGEALERAGMQAPAKVDAIAVTSGPGLEPALWSGIEFAKKTAQEWKLPLFGANHMEGHLISSLAQLSLDVPSRWELQNISFPVLGLLISGGHTQYVLMRDWFSYEIIGETLDDAVGEAFDKVARMLGLPYPGGRAISELAKGARERGASSSVKLPRPMLRSGTCDVSFSGLKTAALYALRDQGGTEHLSEDERAAFAREFEDAVTEVFLVKTRQALQDCGANIFVIGGGVAANAHIREKLIELVRSEFSEVEVRMPELSITGDNAVMIAEAALAHLLAGDWTLENPPADISAAGTLSMAK